LAEISLARRTLKPALRYADKQHRTSTSENMSTTSQRNLRELVGIDRIPTFAPLTASKWFDYASGRPIGSRRTLDLDASNVRMQPASSNDVTRGNS